MKSSLLRLGRLSGLDERRRWVDRDYSCALHQGSLVTVTSSPVRRIEYNSQN
jgi:hypothetical protein